MRQALHALGHKQNSTPLKTENTTACSFVNNNIHQRNGKSWDMQYYWLRDKEAQNEMKIYQKKKTDKKILTKQIIILNNSLKSITVVSDKTMCWIRAVWRK